MLHLHVMKIDASMNTFRLQTQKVTKARLLSTYAHHLTYFSIHWSLCCCAFSCTFFTLTTVVSIGLGCFGCLGLSTCPGPYAARLRITCFALKSSHMYYFWGMLMTLLQFILGSSFNNMETHIAECQGGHWALNSLFIHRKPCPKMVLASLHNMLFLAGFCLLVVAP